ncbi:MAG: hypothetical protein LCH99_07825 [Proteobacteria bacterium]|nr:hypothetical protein [Pseudomonadota bacterium]
MLKTVHPCWQQALSVAAHPSNALAWERTKLSYPAATEWLSEIFMSSTVPGAGSAELRNDDLRTWLDDRRRNQSRDRRKAFPLILPARVENDLYR